MNSPELIFVFILTFWIFTSVLGYFLPTFIAFHRRHRNRVPIMLINIFAGFTVLGWAAALAWAFTKDVESVVE